MTVFPNAPRKESGNSAIINPVQDTVVDYDIGSHTGLIYKGVDNKVRHIYIGMCFN